MLVTSYLRCDIIGYIHLRSTVGNATYGMLCELLPDDQSSSAQTPIVSAEVNEGMFAMCTSGMFLVYISISSRVLPL
jgi:hypothetical protein